jgi:hypothetical protein
MTKPFPFFRKVNGQTACQVRLTLRPLWNLMRKVASIESSLPWSVRDERTILFAHCSSFLRAANDGGFAVAYYRIYCIGVSGHIVHREGIDVETHQDAVALVHATCARGFHELIADIDV